MFDKFARVCAGSLDLSRTRVAVNSGIARCAVLNAAASIAGDATLDTAAGAESYV